MEIQKIMDLMHFNDRVHNSEMTEKKALQLSEGIKEEWWKENKNRILEKINFQ
jgi:hypothetical protein